MAGEGTKEIKCKKRREEEKESKTMGRGIIRKRTGRYR